MIQPSLQQANRETWAQKIAFDLIRFNSYWEGRTLEVCRQESPIMQRWAENCTRYALYFLVTEHEKEANVLLEIGIAAAHEALRTESFNPPMAPDPKPQHYDQAKAAGRMMTLKALHYATWFQSGQRPMHLWEEMIMAHYAYAKISIISQVDELVSACVEGGRYKEALYLFNTGHVDDFEEYAMAELTEQFLGQELPKDLRFSRSVPRTMAVLAQYALGTQGLEPLARRAVERWYIKCQNWATPSEVAPHYPDRIAWVYLQGKHFTGVTDLMPMLRNLRGY